MNQTAAAESEDHKAVQARRTVAQIDPKTPLCGLALSGGGIRSATFCIGLIRALAANGVLRLFDYLSTVSGGGYAGAALGRLYRPGTGSGRIEQGLASEGSLLLWWLRSNGRYLIPAGLRDLLQAAAFHIRGFLATQLEAAVIALLLAVVVVLPHVLVEWLGLPRYAREWLQSGGTLWWAALPLPALLAGVVIAAYWFSRDDRDGARLQDMLLSLAMLAASLLLIWRMLQTAGGEPQSHFQQAVLVAIIGLLACFPAGYGVRMLRRSIAPADDRIIYTNALAWALATGAVIVAFGLLDLLSWIAAWLWINEDELRLSGGAGLVALLVVAARAALPALQNMQRSSAGGLPLDRLAHIAGLLLLVLLVLMWFTLMQAFVFLVENGPATQAVYATTSATRCGLAAAVLLLYVACTLWNLQQLNRSSLHEFYRSRLARAYISVGNYRNRTDPNAGERFPDSPLVTNTRELTQHTQQVTRLLVGDDVTLRDYQPHRTGGPIHLINCCINQTRDDRTGNYNADRKGIALTVSTLGLETGTRLPASSPALERTLLSQWVAISGAAVGSGMGSQTRPGTSALFFLSGLRLGYWWLTDVTSRFGKYVAVVAEMLARFPGLRSPAWYVSDGGHFDNTGVYALLKRRLPLIVLADCGADPRYLFSDVENLVRKARLDYAAEIHFVDRNSIPDPAFRKLLGTPDTIGPQPGDEYMLLARVTYSDGKAGALLVVKPRRIRCLPLDIMGYSDRDLDFPQQTTSDQFFDEAQWESYQALGRLMGSSLTPQVLLNLPAWVATAKTLDVASIAPASNPAPAPSRRERVATTVGASLGIGAIASILLAGWQLLDEHNRLEAERNRAVLEAAGRVADTLASAREGAIFSPELKVRLDALLGLATSSAIGEGLHHRALRTLAASMEPLCAKLGQKGEESECRSYVQSLRGHKEDGVVRQAMLQYWVDQSERRMSAQQKAVADVRMTTPLERKQLLMEPAAKLLPSEKAEPKAPPGVVQKADLARWPAWECASSSKTGLRIYIHIYDERERDLARVIAQGAIEAHVAVPAIQNVVVAAQRQNTAPPVRWNAITWLYRGDEGRRCAEAGKAWLESKEGRRSQVVELPKSLQAAPGVIELWLPPVKPSIQ